MLKLFGLYFAIILAILGCNQVEPKQETPNSLTNKTPAPEATQPNIVSLEKSIEPTKIAVTSESSIDSPVEPMPSSCLNAENTLTKDARDLYQHGEGLTREDLENAALINMQAAEVVDAVSKGAVCNDGTPAGYYYLPSPIESGSNRWLIHLSGGGFCSNNADCHERMANSPRRMSSLQGRQFAEGILSPLLLENPDFYDANHVYVHYCSSDFWSGTREASSDTDGFHFKGRIILSSLIDDLALQTVEGLPSLSDATEVLLTGSSAGGVGVMANLDWLAERLPSANVCGINDAGVLFDIESYNEQFVLTDSLAEGFDYWHGTLDETCMLANEGEESICFLTNRLREHITTPIFLQLAQKDPFFLERLGIDDVNSAEQQIYIETFRQRVQDTLSIYPAAFSKNGNRPNHSTLIRQLFVNREIDNVALFNVVGNWYFNRSGPISLIEE